ncbi:transglutaminase-like domain-containing protein [Aromatoleum sp.]|uniref:transglutaminase-like domain-containing protein n=1 Tax=Aromatoleum sp. TaxID=2307007 RepID=UPI002FC8B9F7
MNRRNFLRTTAIATSFALPAWSRAAAPATSAAFAPHPENGWRIFELTTRVEPAASGPTSVWVPLPSVSDADWIRPMGNLWRGNAPTMNVVSDAEYGASMLHAEWPDADQAVLEIVSRFATRDRAVDLSRPGAVRPLPDADRALYTRATALIPTDGIVLDTATEIVGRARSDEDKARAIYEWVVDNTFRNPQTRGCGLGDVRAMLEAGDLSGKCADLNALYVGLARAAGLPARDVYGLRVANSRFGYKSLGKSGDVSKAQHCRAEVWLDRFGWVPVDPADVRKVALEEPPGQLAIDDAKVVAARKTLFGAWEMNWLGYNFAHDVRLPGSRGPAVPFLMYPQGESAGRRFDSLDPSAFRYTLTATEISAA